MLPLLVPGSPIFKKVFTNSRSFKLPYRFVSVFYFNGLQKCLETKIKQSFKEKEKIMKASSRNNGGIFNCRLNFKAF